MMVARYQSSSRDVVVLAQVVPRSQFGCGQMELVRFPTDFTLAEAIDHVVGWFLAGLALAAVVWPIRPKPL